MTKKGEVYKCEICGNIVEVLHTGEGELVCCGQPMNLQEEHAEDPEKGEKHIPVIEGNFVKVGSVPHPMTNEHSIEWIEATDGKETTKVFLKPGEEPKAEFSFEPTAARAYCNLHGLWATN
jgi:superoxide reductase